MLKSSKTKLKNLYVGAKCVIIGNGPSLTINLLKQLQQKELFSFAANGFCLVFDQISFAPNAVCMSNYEAIEKYGFLYPDITLKFFKAGWVNELSTSIVPENLIELPFACNHDLGEHCLPFIKDGNFSLNPFAENFCGDTVLLDFAIPLAFYMGFNEIYLCGVDCDYSLGYFDERYEISATDTFQGMVNGDFSISIPSYRYAKDYLSSHGCELFKLTESKRLDFIPTCKIEDI